MYLFEFSFSVGPNLSNHLLFKTVQILHQKYTRSLEIGNRIAMQNKGNEFICMTGKPLSCSVPPMMELLFFYSSIICPLEVKQWRMFKIRWHALFYENIREILTKLKFFAYYLWLSRILGFLFLNVHFLSTHKRATKRTFYNCFVLLFQFTTLHLLKPQQFIVHKKCT